MGKQINYWMDYDNFCQLASLALELGCIIVKEDAGSGKIIKASDVSIITKDCYRYYFYFSYAGPLKIKEVENIELIDRFNTETGNAIIEAGYSQIADDKKQIRRERLYLTTGYYNKNDEFIYRPDIMVDVYNKLARKVKKLATYTELTTVFNGKEWIHKEYLTPCCLQLINEEGYSLLQG